MFVRPVHFVRRCAYALILNTILFDYTDRPSRFSGAEEATGAVGRFGKQPGGKAAERVLPFAPSGKKPPLVGSKHELADPAGAASFTQKREPREAVTPGGLSPRRAR